MAESNEEVRDNDKDTLMEVRGIIDGILDSGSGDYNSALELIATTVKDYNKNSIIMQQGGIVSWQV